jgi:transcriptional regulator with XRE-family HTH domain
MPDLEDLEPLLTAPSEALDVEYKGWLDLRNNDEHKGTLAKAAIALANEGGGYIVIGLREERPNLISEERPATIPAYDQDLINQIIRRFAAPSFHCALTVLRHPQTGFEHAVISIPGGFGFPVMSKSATPENSIRAHFCYMRKPGPESAPPENQNDWERLLSKCFRNRREDMLDAIRAIVEGTTQPAAVPAPSATEKQKEFSARARARWDELISPLPRDSFARCAQGHYEFDYALLGDLSRQNLPDLLNTLRQCEQRFTGWPQFWVPTREEIQPAVVDDHIECWIGRPYEGRQFGDVGHADFWRVSPEGRAFLLRGYIEDNPEALREPFEPTEILDPALVIRRVAECLLHGAGLASVLAPNQASQVLFNARWLGLAGRKLNCINPERVFIGEYKSQQNEFVVTTTVDVSQISDNLPEIIHPLLAPLFERFSFFRLDMRMVSQEIGFMRERRF